MKINFKVKSKSYELEVEESLTIKIVKEKLEQILDSETQLKAKDMKFISCGRILGDDLTLKELKIEENASIFVTGGPAKPLPKTIPSKSTPPPVSNPSYHQHLSMPSGQQSFAPGLGINEETMKGQIENMINNPEILDMFFGSQMIGKSEEEKIRIREQALEQMRMVKDNPQLLHSIMEQFKNMDPSTLNNLMMGHQQSFVQNPLQMQPPMYQPPQMPQNPYGMNYVNPAYPVPSPSIPCCHGFYPPAYNVPSMQQIPSMIQTPINEEELKKKYENELKILDEMELKNEKLNIKALVKAEGDINIAIEIIFKWMEQLPK